MSYCKIGSKFESSFGAISIGKTRRKSPVYRIGIRLSLLLASSLLAFTAFSQSLDRPSPPESGANKALETSIDSYMSCLSAAIDNLKAKREAESKELDSAISLCLSERAGVSRSYGKDESATEFLITLDKVAQSNLDSDGRLVKKEVDEGSRK